MHVIDAVKHKMTESVDTTANQTVRLDLGPKDGVKSIRIGFTDQLLTVRGGLAVWTRFITGRGLRHRFRAALPHTLASLNAYDPCDTALGLIGGIGCGADKLARVAHRRTTRRWSGCSGSKQSRANRRCRASWPRAAAVPARRYRVCTDGGWQIC